MISALAFTLLLAAAETSPQLKVGEEAPRFSLPGSDGKTIQLSAFKGKKKVVLAFFQKAITGGCTRELSRLRDHQKMLSVSPWDCRAAAELPIPAFVGDACTDDFDFRYLIYGGGEIHGFKDSLNRQHVKVSELTKGNYTVKYLIKTSVETNLTVHSIAQ